MLAEKRRKIDHFVIAVLMADCDRRDNVQAAQDLLNVGRDFGLNRAYDHVLAALLATAALVEHAKGFSHSRGVPQKNLQAPALLTPFISFDAAEQFLRIRPAIHTSSHFHRINREG